MYISLSIAGATYSGQEAEKRVASKRLSHKPSASLPIVLAEAGARMIKSAQFASSTWLFQEPAGELNSIKTGFFDKTEKVSGVTKSVAGGVIITFTSAPSFTSRRTKKTAL